MSPAAPQPTPDDAHPIDGQSLGLRVWIVPVIFLAAGALLTVTTTLSPLWSTVLFTIGIALALLFALVEFESLPPIDRQPAARRERAPIQLPIATQRFLRHETERFDREVRLPVGR